MNTRASRAMMQDALSLHAPPVLLEPDDAQRARAAIAIALADAEEIPHPRLRIVVRRGLMRAAAELGCAVCGKRIRFDELEHCELTQRSLVHLWGTCSDSLAERLHCTVDEALTRIASWSGA